MTWGDGEWPGVSFNEREARRLAEAEARLMSQARRAHAIGRLIRDLVFLAVVVAAGYVLAFVVLAR